MIILNVELKVVRAMGDCHWADPTPRFENMEVVLNSCSMGDASIRPNLEDAVRVIEGGSDPFPGFNPSFSTGF